MLHLNVARSHELLTFMIMLYVCLLNVVWIHRRKPPRVRDSRLVEGTGF